MATPHFPSASELMQELAVAPEVDVIGIVAPPGGSSSLSPGPVGQNFCFLPVKNQGWLQDDQEAISEEDFLNAVTLTAIDMNSDGSFEFYYDDGGLFCGHCIIVGGSLSKGGTDVDFDG